MRRYDDPVEVRKGMVPGSGGPVEAPEQFLWQGRLWRVRDVVAHWVETGAWWQGRTSAQPDDRPDDRPDDQPGSRPGGDLLAEREVWRVAAGRPGATGPASGVFDLAFDWVAGGWVLTRCLD